MPWLTGTHVPSAEGELQIPQPPLHVALQHTPFAQKPVEHSMPDPQAAPCGFLQKPPMQL